VGGWVGGCGWVVGGCVSGSVGAAGVAMNETPF
jgi:hypothetical protein